MNCIQWSPKEDHRRVRGGEGEGETRGQGQGQVVLPDLMRDESDISSFGIKKHVRCQRFPI